MNFIICVSCNAGVKISKQGKKLLNKSWFIIFLRVPMYDLLAGKYSGIMSVVFAWNYVFLTSIFLPTISDKN
jgi:hypothetical protein